MDSKHANARNSVRTLSNVEQYTYTNDRKCFLPNTRTTKIA